MPNYVRYDADPQEKRQTREIFSFNLIRFDADANKKLFKSTT